MELESPLLLLPFHYRGLEHVAAPRIEVHRYNSAESVSSEGVGQKRKGLANRTKCMLLCRDTTGITGKGILLNFSLRRWPADENEIRSDGVCIYVFSTRMNGVDARIVAHR